MRMQLKDQIFLVLLAIPTLGAAQNIDTSSAVGPIEIDILSSYYAQDGIHSPVTGGRGTEKLSDLTSSVIVSIPVRNRTYSINMGSDYITSASTDNIDLDITSDSHWDTRVHGDFGVTKQLDKRKSYHVGTGFSVEYDVGSFNMSGGFAMESKSRNTSLDINAKWYNDTWLIYEPVELSKNLDENEVEPSGIDKRNSLNFSVSLAQIATRKMQFAVTSELIYQKGLLATPFHRVYFDDGYNADGLNERQTILSGKIRRREYLPRSRFKAPVSLRVHYSLGSGIILKSFYRHYRDDFGIIGNTIEFESALKPNKTIAFFPFYRFHTQTAAKYFAPFGEHSLDAVYYTSDYDLSALQSQLFGLGFRYEPLFGIGKKPGELEKASKINFKNVTGRFARYYRSDGLDAWIVSIGLSFRTGQN